MSSHLREYLFLRPIKNRKKKTEQDAEKTFRQTVLF